MDEFTTMPDARDLTQVGWNRYRNVFMYNVAYEGGGAEYYFIAPVTDDGKVEDILTVVVGLAKMDDEDAAMGRDDQISAVLNTLRVK